MTYCERNESGEIYAHKRKPAAVSRRYVRSLVWT
jgi:hypothetical protein